MFVRGNEIQAIFDGAGYRSPDFGTTWYAMEGEPASATDVAFSASNEQDSFIGSSGRLYVFSENDAGIYSYVQGAEIEGVVNQIDVDPISNIALVGTTNKLYKTNTWGKSVLVLLDKPITDVAVGGNYLVNYRMPPTSGYELLVNADGNVEGFDTFPVSGGSFWSAVRFVDGTYIKSHYIGTEEQLQATAGFEHRPEGAPYGYLGQTQELNIPNRIILSLSFMVGRTPASPPGDYIYHFMIWDSDGNVVVDINMGWLGNLSTDAAWISADLPSPVLLNGIYYIGTFIDRGTATHHLGTIHTGDVKAGEMFAYSLSVSEPFVFYGAEAYDLAYKYTYTIPHRGFFDIDDLSSTSLIGGVAEIRPEIWAYQEGEGDVNMLIKTHGTDYADEVTIAESLTNRRKVICSNPYTNQPWTRNEVNTVQLGVNFTPVGSGSLFCDQLLGTVWINYGTDVIGATPIDRDYLIAGVAGTTVINRAHPASANGTVRFVEIFSAKNMSGVKVATFHKVGGADPPGTGIYSTRDTVNLGEVPVGYSLHTTFLTAVAGDYIGIYLPEASSLEADLGWLVGEQSIKLVGDYIPCTNQSFTPIDTSAKYVPSIRGVLFIR